MIPNESEIFTAEQAIKSELYEAIKRGETTFAGRYELNKNGTFDFKQQNFVFNDNHKNLRVGKFSDVDEVLEFMNYIREREVKENV